MKQLAISARTISLDIRHWEFVISPFEDTVPRDQILMGIAIAAVCLLGLLGAKWFQRETKKGRRFTEWFGEERGLLVLRLLFGVGILLGALLATDVIRPMQW